MHSIQIELNRGLYMDESSFAKHAGFTALKNNLDGFVAALADYVRGQLATSA